MAMVRNAVILPRFLAAVAAAAMLHPVFAQESPPETADADTLGWHLVRPGDTLEGITEYYLGTSTLWRENWKLNPQVNDPHLLRIGARLRVITHRQLPPQTAEVRQLRRRVEEKPHPNPWTPAEKGDLLKEEDGVRTFARSSAEIAFDDGTSLVLTENSLVFLREVRRDLVGVNHEKIEVVEGQADLEARPRRADSSKIEVFLGGVRATPRTGTAGVARSRLRRGDTGGAQVMVYGGSAEVAAAGTQVQVPAGMGTNVPEGEPPRPPEKLLDPPTLLRPSRNQEIDFGNPVLEWQPVETAVSYTVEVCLDGACKQLHSRGVGVTGSGWQPDRLSTGELFWRVTAVSASGLDGTPSRSRRLVVRSDRPDLEPPVVVLRADSPIRRGEQDHVVVRSGGRFSLAAHDDVVGVASVEYRWNTGPWLKAGADDLRFPDSSGDFLLEFRATDRIGRVSQVWPVAVRVLGAALEPPQVSRFPRR